MRDRAMQLKKNKEKILAEWREQNKEFDGVVDAEVISQTVSMMTGIPLTRIEKKEAERLLNLEDELHKIVVSQNEAVSAVSRAIRRSSRRASRTRAGRSARSSSSDPRASARR